MSHNQDVEPKRKTHNTRQITPRRLGRALLRLPIGLIKGLSVGLVPAFFAMGFLEERFFIYSFAALGIYFFISICDSTKWSLYLVQLRFQGIGLNETEKNQLQQSAIQRVLDDNLASSISELDKSNKLKVKMIQELEFLD